MADLFEGSYLRLRVDSIAAEARDGEFDGQKDDFHFFLIDTKFQRAFEFIFVDLKKYYIFQCSTVVMIRYSYNSLFVFITIWIASCQTAIQAL